MIRERSTVLARAPIFTSVGLIFSIASFAGNSLITRAAFAAPPTNPGLFVSWRLVSGAAALAVFMAFRGGRITPRLSDMGGICALGVYAIAFTFAYTVLGAATGALILFATVQLALGGMEMVKGPLPSIRELIGLMVAMAGLGWFLVPKAMTDWGAGVPLMITAGLAWAYYTILGRSVEDPIGRTARNFVGTLPLALFLAILTWDQVDMRTVLLACASGILTSAAGYVIWYSVLPNLSLITAGASQLIVPVVTAVAAIFLFNEPMTTPLLISGCLITFGILLTIKPAEKR